MEARPLIVEVRRHSREDGPGIRSVVFFKGCPLRCVFCQNPETQRAGPEIAFSPEACLQCGACQETCPRGAIDMNLPGRIHRSRCDCCGACAQACPGNGLRLVGRHYPVQELCEILLRDRAFYRHSGGGVTLSGGECSLHTDYLGDLLPRLKSRGIHVAVETCGYFDYASFKARILPYVGLIYFDVKFADPAVHAAFTGKDNRRILDNLRRLLSEEGVAVRPRIPLVPGLTATAENLSGIVDILCRFGANAVELLSYNPLGASMAPRLGKPAPAVPGSFQKITEEADIRRLFAGIVEEKKRRDFRRVRATGRGQHG